MKSKYFQLAAYCVLGFMFCLAGCGGGGGGGDDDNSHNVPQPIESSYTYTLLGMNFNDESEPGLEIQWTQNGQFLGVFRLHPNPGNSIGFVGTVDLQTRQVTISQGAGIDIYDLNEPAIFNPNHFRIVVGEAIVIPSGAPPSAGMLFIQALDTDQFSMRLTFGGPNGDVWIEYDMDGDGFFEDTDTWAWDLPDNLSETKQRMAYSSIKACFFMMRQVLLVEDALGLLGENEDALNPGPYQDTGDRFSDFNLTPPTGIADQGSLTVTWIDASGDSELGPGDTFQLVNDQVWLNAPETEEDVIFDGQIDFKGYTDIVNGSGETERIGFEPYLNSTGGVFLDEFTEYFTWTDGAQVSIRDQYTIDGAFSIIFAMD